MNDELKKNENAAWWQPGLIMFARLSGWIGIPIILALFLGKWLDERYGTEPWLFLATVGAAFILTSVGIVREAKGAINKIEQEGELESEKEDPSDKLRK